MAKNDNISELFWLQINYFNLSPSD